MKNLKILSVLLLATALVVLTSSVGAYMRKQTPTVENAFVPAEVSCEVVENFDGKGKDSITVKNTSTIEAYLRLRLVTYWVVENELTGEMEILSKISKPLNFQFNETDWLKSGDTYYYKAPVAPEGVTSDLLIKENPIILEKNPVDGSYQVVEVFAEAIQSLPEEAVEAAWNVNVVGEEGSKTIESIQP